jgi:DnaJ-class molecular chaperone
VRSKYDVPNEFECKECKGLGYTQFTAPKLGQTDDGKPVTLALGSGCPDCLGTGRTHERSGKTHP